MIDKLTWVYSELSFNKPSFREHGKLFFDQRPSTFNKLKWPSRSPTRIIFFQEANNCKSRHRVALSQTLNEISGYVCVITNNSSKVDVAAPSTV